jgi:hypothetical protein
MLVITVDASYLNVYINCKMHGMLIGYFADLQAHMGPSKVNGGYNQRSYQFRKGIKAGGDFQPATFIGRLHHDLARFMP